MKWVCSPKCYSPLANWPWLRISPQSSLYVIYCLILLPHNDWWALPVFLCKSNSIKAHWGKGSWPFFFESLVSLSSPSRSCLGRLSLIHGGWGSSAGRAPPKISLVKVCFSFISQTNVVSSGLCITKPLRDLSEVLPSIESMTPTVSQPFTPHLTKGEMKEKVWRTAHEVFMGLEPGSCSLLPPISHWPEPSHVVLPICKGSWEM